MLCMIWCMYVMWRRCGLSNLTLPSLVGHHRYQSQILPRCFHFDIVWHFRGNFARCQWPSWLREWKSVITIYRNRCDFSKVNRTDTCTRRLSVIPEIQDPALWKIEEWKVHYNRINQDTEHQPIITRKKRTSLIKSKCPPIFFECFQK
jgi:hypothetical protein